MTERRSTGEGDGVATPLDHAVKGLERNQLLRSPVPSTGRHYPWLFLGWLCVAAGLLIPPYVLA